MLCTLPEHTVGIRAYRRRNNAEIFGITTCRRTALHGVAEGEWELAPLTLPVPYGWRQISATLMQRIIWERITP